MGLEARPALRHLSCPISSRVGAPGQERCRPAFHDSAQTLGTCSGPGSTARTQKPDMRPDGVTRVNTPHTPEGPVRTLLLEETRSRGVSSGRGLRLRGGFVADGNMGGGGRLLEQPDRTRSAGGLEEFLSLRASAGLLLRKGVSGERPGASRAESARAGPEKNLHQRREGTRPAVRPRAP